MSFKQRYQLSERKTSSKKLREQFSDRIPIIIEVAPSSKITLSKHKFLVPENITLGYFMSIIRKYINILSNESIFVSCENNIIPTMTISILELYTKYCNDDGFLYLYITSENTFGVPL